MRTISWAIVITLLCGCPSSKDKNMANVPSGLLDSLLDSANDEEFEQRLRLHGPISDGEVSALIKKAKSPQARTRRNATALLRLTRDSDAKAALVRFAAETSDEAQYAVALGGLLEDPRLPSLVRPELLKAALSSSDPEVLAVALQVSAKTKQPGVEAAVESALSHPNLKVRQAALRAAYAASPAKFEPQLVAELLKEDSPLTPLELYRALSHSDDSKMAEVFARSLKLQSGNRSTDFHNGIYFGGGRKPWLRALLLELLKQGGNLSNSAFHILESWGDSDKTLCAFCIDALQHAPPTTDPDYHLYMVNLEQCRVYLGTLAGHAPFTPEEREPALIFAQSWIKSHAP